MTKRNIIKDLSLSEISGVTVPAQAHALVSIMKGEHVELAKYLATDEGAKTFDAFMADEQVQRVKNKIYESVWPLMDALRNSIVSIKLDASLNDEQKNERISEAVAQFDVAVKGVTSQHPRSSAINVDGLLKSLTIYEESMSEDIAKKAAELETQVAALTKSLADAEVLAKLSDDEKAYLAGLKDEDAEKFKKATADERKKLMQKSAESDEVFKSVDGVEIRKSAVGDSVFAILKSQDEALRATRAELAKQAERAQTVELTKRAEDEFKHLPGDTVAKVAVLKFAAGADEATRTALETMLKAADAALAPAFADIGTAGGKPQDITKAARRDELVKDYMAANPTVSKAAAEVAVISAHPDLYEG